MKARRNPQTEAATVCGFDWPEVGGPPRGGPGRTPAHSVVGRGLGHRGRWLCFLRRATGPLSPRVRARRLLGSPPNFSNTWVPGRTPPPKYCLSVTSFLGGSSAEGQFLWHTGRSRGEGLQVYAHASEFNVSLLTQSAKSKGLRLVALWPQCTGPGAGAGGGG